MIVVAPISSIMSDYLQQRFTLSEIEAGDILVILISFILILIANYLGHSRHL